MDKGLHLDLPVVHYKNTKETKAFLLKEALRIDPTFQRKSGTSYLLNRWREEQEQQGRTITYRDVVQQMMTLRKTKQGPLRVEHGRYINFVSDFMKAYPKAPRKELLNAWAEVKIMDIPKTFAAWVKHRFTSKKKDL